MTEEAARVLRHCGAEVRIFNPTGLPLVDDSSDTHDKVQELRELSLWSEAQVWCSPERHGAMTGYSERVESTEELSKRVNWPQT
jgi:arsenic resistance protein ArsH